MATTSPDEIWTPDSGDDYALTTDLAAMADSIQEVFTERAWANEDSGSITSATGVFSLAAGWSLGSFRVRRVGLVGMYYVSFTRTGAAISVPTSGDVINTVVGAFSPEWVPSGDFVAASGNQGRVAHGYVDSAGVLTLTSVGGSADIPVGGNLSLGGSMFF